jgi:hypothetical protein
LRPRAAFLARRIDHKQIVESADVKQAPDLAGNAAKRALAVSLSGRRDRSSRACRSRACKRPQMREAIGDFACPGILRHALEIGRGLEHLVA